MGTALGAVGDVPGGVEKLALFEREEIVGENGTSEKHVVVEVDEVLGETGDAVEIHLDGGGGEGGENRGVGEDVPVGDDLDLGIVRIEPRGDLPVCHDKNAADPRSKTLQ